MIFKNPNEKYDYYEQTPTTIYENATVASKEVAKEIADLIRDRNEQGKPAVLGLATGSTPKQVYAELVRLHKEEGLSFKQVITFNLDEYYPIEPDSLQSYVRFMNEQLFDHIDIPEDQVHIPDGTIEEGEIADYCNQYEAKVEEVGGIDLQVLGIGRTGHIGFNEPGSLPQSRTRLITLDEITRQDAASDFFGQEYVPRRAITMGIGTILDARRVVLMAWGEGKAPVIREADEGTIKETVPATYLQNHPNASIILDEAAAEKLTRKKTPWVLARCNWTEELTKKAVVWLCKKTEKPILKLTDADYNEHGMGDLLSQSGPAYNINLKLFNELQRTITGWPGGKPNTEGEGRPERAKPFPKRSLIFSPHPDDDVISMGGTFIRLVDQGHDVHVAYQTSGNIAVFDDDVLRFADFVSDYQHYFDSNATEAKERLDEIRSFLESKEPGQIDTEEVRQIKGLIRKGEAKSAARYCGVKDENMHFLTMPFYETGRVDKKPLSEEDIQITADLLREVKPHQIYAAGDLADPHGTHAVCLQAIFGALEECKDDDWIEDCNVWLYRGAWQEWEISDIEMAVPLSPKELDRKRRAVFKHQSQKDRPLFPGSDPREFWQRSDQRNRDTAKLYDKLGFAEYEAMEAFVRHKI